MSLLPTRDASEADWIVSAEGPWYVVGTYGPPVFETYARVALHRDDVTAHGYSHHPADDKRILAAVLAILGDHTSTPDALNVAIWVGFGHSLPRAAHFEIPAREFALLTGTVEDALDPTSLDLEPGAIELPQMIWPHDRAWMVCWDVDEVNNFSVGGSAVALAQLQAADGVSAEIVPYGTPEDDWTW
ncbi:hypothetical protein AERO_01900 [Aeromicrobium fastidiosum]|uniref:hypothetical protein n=1 Tax=Aeromicrobium fastidiosum TaxID=52699 RepID=UPI0020231C12|nr:hypothetical protein [Aeromicrobium fastidiosum]MCL8250123.1 hypothetical protein [Aeromicrobium fastidiosum]